MDNKQLYEEYKKYDYDFDTLFLSDNEYRQLLIDKTLKDNFCWDWVMSNDGRMVHAVRFVSNTESATYPVPEPPVVRPYAPELLVETYRYTTKEIEEKLAPLIDKVINHSKNEDHTIS